jgi:hypothetical protein
MSNINDGARYVATEYSNASEIANWLSRLNWTDPAVTTSARVPVGGRVRVKQEDDSTAAALVDAAPDFRCATHLYIDCYPAIHYLRG